MKSRHLSIRIEQTTADALEQVARYRAETRSAVAQRLIEEGLRMQRYPLIVFRDGPAGRRPGVAGTGLDVWEIVRTVDPQRPDAAAAAASLDVPVRFVEAALAYYAEYRDEVDAWLDDLDREAEGIERTYPSAP